MNFVKLKPVNRDTPEIDEEVDIDNLYAGRMIIIGGTEYRAYRGVTATSYILMDEKRNQYFVTAENQ